LGDRQGVDQPRVGRGTEELSGDGAPQHHEQDVDRDPADERLVAVVVAAAEQPTAIATKTTPRTAAKTVYPRYEPTLNASMYPS